MARLISIPSLVFPLVVAICGCGESLPTAEVEGTVKLNGQPLDKIQVQFWPEGKGLRSRGTTDSEGRFKLTTDDGEQQGATVGSHKVVLHDLGMFPDKIAGGLRAQEDADLSEGKKPRIAAEYTDPQKSGLKADVVAGQKNEVSLDVKPFSASGGTKSRER